MKSDSAASPTFRSISIQIEALEARIAPAAILGLDENNGLVLFDSARPTVILSSLPITGIDASERVIGIDFRPADGGLYAITRTPAGQGELYTIDAHTGAATSIGVLKADPSDSSAPYAGLDGFYFGFDFNPVADRLRVVSDLNQNLRINPVLNATTGFVHVVTDTTLTPGGSIIGGEAYSNTIFGAAPATQTTLFGIDYQNDTLVRQGAANFPPGDSPNNGVLTVVGSLGVVTSDPRIGFDIPDDSDIDATDVGIASLVVDGKTSLYSVDLTTGFASSLGKIGNGLTALIGIADVPGSLAFKNAKTATFIDVDGDKVTVKVSTGTLGLGNLVFGAATTSAGGQQLQLVDLSRDLGEFAAANLKISAKRDTIGGAGDGRVNVGAIDAQGVNLNNVTIAGDLGRIEVGNSSGALALKRLDVVSMGLLGTSTQGDAAPSEYDLQSSFFGNVETIKIRTSATGIFDDFDFVTLGIFVDGDLNKLTVGGDASTVSIAIVGDVETATISGEFGGEIGSILDIFGDVEKLIFKNDVVDSLLTVSGHARIVKINGSLNFSSLVVEGFSGNELAIEKLVIRGDVFSSDILVGTRSSFSPARDAGGPAGIVISGGSSDVAIGDVVVNGNWIASDLAVGALEGNDGVYGTDDDVLNNDEDFDDTDFIARIASIRIKGQALGSDNGDEHFGIVAEEIGFLKVGTTNYLLSPGRANDDIVLGFSDNFRARETGVFASGGAAG